MRLLPCRSLRLRYPSWPGQVLRRCLHLPCSLPPVPAQGVSLPQRCSGPSLGCPAMLLLPCRSLRLRYPSWPVQVLRHCLHLLCSLPPVPAQGASLPLYYSDPSLGCPAMLLLPCRSLRLRYPSLPGLVLRHYQNLPCSLLPVPAQVASLPLRCSDPSLGCPAMLLLPCRNLRLQCLSLPGLVLRHYQNLPCSLLPVPAQVASLPLRYSDPSLGCPEGLL